jgi:tetratricopeptide (TPR) repeat protein
MPSGHHHHPRRSDEEPDEVEFESYLQMERTLRHIRRLTGKRDFPDAESAAAFLETLSEKDLKKAAAELSSDPRGMAQEFAYEAMETEDEEESLEFANKALELDPQCVDAMLVVAESTAESQEEMIELMGKAVDAGAKNVQELEGRPRNAFWDVVELSPYLRALHRTADLLRLAGRTEEAVGRLETMLKLDPDDNHGARDLLLGCYLLQRDLPRARGLLQQFADDRSAPMLWSATLERFLARDRKGASAALRAARDENKYVEDYLALRKAPEGEPPGQYESGDENEALYCVDAIGMAWMHYPEAVEWLVESTR